jgi:UrcA family protein
MNIRIVTASVLLASALFSAAQAQDNREPTQVRVSTAGVDFSQPASVEAFYGRLHRAAVAACDSHMGRDLAAWAEDRACAKQALNRAVAEIDRPTLLALHAERTGQPLTAPAQLAAN